MRFDQAVVSLLDIAGVETNRENRDAFFNHYPENSQFIKGVIKKATYSQYRDLLYKILIVLGENGIDTNVNK
jgi:hypothetical protein